MAGFPANLFPIFCSQGHLPPPSTRALLYFRRLWEVGEIPLSKDLGIPPPIYLPQSSYSSPTANIVSLLGGVYFISPVLGIEH